MTSRLMLVVALFGIFASATVTFAQYQQSQGGQQNQQQYGGQQYQGGQQGQYQGQGMDQQRMGQQEQRSGMQGNQQEMMRQYQGSQQGQQGEQGMMPREGFDPNMDPSRMGDRQGMQGNQQDMMRQYQGGQQGQQGGQYQGGQRGQQGQRGGQQGGQQGGQGQQGQMPQGQGMMQGPGKEFFSRMIQEMKSHMKPFEMMVKNFDKQITKVQSTIKKCGISPNFEEMKTAVTSAKDTIAKVKSLDPKAEELDFSPEEVGETAQTVSESQRQLMQYTQFCQGISQREKDLKSIISRFGKIEKNLQKTKLDLSDSLNEQRSDIAVLQSMLKEAKDQASQDIEKAMDTVMDFEDKRNDVFDRERALQMAANFSRELKNLERDSKRLASSVKNEKNRALKRNLSADELTDTYASFTNAHVALKDLAAKKNVDPEDLVAAMEEVFDARRDIDESLNQLRQGAPKKVTDEFALPGGWNDIAKYSGQSQQHEQYTPDMEESQGQE